MKIALASVLCLAFCSPSSAIGVGIWISCRNCPPRAFLASPIVVPTVVVPLQPQVPGPAAQLPPIQFQPIAPPAAIQSYQAVPTLRWGFFGRRLVPGTAYVPGPVPGPVYVPWVPPQPLQPVQPSP